MIYKYKGYLDLYFETGISGLTIYVDHINPNPWSKTFFLGKKTNLKIKIYEPTTKQLVYDGSWSFDRANTIKNQHMPSPKEIDPVLWQKYFLNKYLVEFETTDPLEVDLCSFKLSFNVDAWILKNGTEEAIAKDCSVFEIIQNKQLVIDKNHKRFVSDSPISNFNINKDSILIQTKTEFFILKKSEKTLI